MIHVFTKSTTIHQIKKLITNTHTTWWCFLNQIVLWQQWRFAHSVERHFNAGTFPLLTYSNCHQNQWDYRVRHPQWRCCLCPDQRHQSTRQNSDQENIGHQIGIVKYNPDSLLPSPSTRENYGFVEDRFSFSIISIYQKFWDQIFTWTNGEKTHYQEVEAPPRHLAEKRKIPPSHDGTRVRNGRRRR